eukprot:316892-Chlamydomonas_euryale.AAC.4
MFGRPVPHLQQLRLPVDHDRVGHDDQVRATVALVLHEVGDERHDLRLEDREVEDMAHIIWCEEGTTQGAPPRWEVTEMEALEECIVLPLYSQVFVHGTAGLGFGVSVGGDTLAPPQTRL